MAGSAPTNTVIITFAVTVDANVFTGTQIANTALITTAYGLMVAIPLLVLYKIVQGRNDRLVVEMEEEAISIVELLEDQRRAERRAAAAGEGQG